MEYYGIFDSPTGDVNAAGYRVKAIRSGLMLEIEIYPYWETKGEKQRAKKAMETKAAQERVNRKRSLDRAKRLANANFTQKDIAIRLSYSGEPPDPKQAQRDLQNYIKRINRRRKKQGLPPARYMYSTEWQTPAGKQKKRIHHHLLISGGLDRTEMEAIWGKGYANTQQLQFDEYGITGKALYIAGHPHKYRRWSCSKNLKKPKETLLKHRMTRRKAERIARDVEEARAQSERQFKNYYFVDRDAPRYSGVVPGAYIHITMRRKQ